MDKKRDFLAFVIFFIGLWSIPFWYPFIIQFIVDNLLYFANINSHNIVFNFLVYLYGMFDVLAGLAIIKEKEWYMRVFSFLSIIIGIVSTVFLIFGV